MLLTSTHIMSDRLSISIAIFGTVSVGKSTFLNGLFVEPFSETKLKRTTMVPQVYMETDDFSQTSSVEAIQKSNAEINAKLQDKESLTSEECREVIHMVNKIPDFNITLKPECFLNIYDIPGLNDAKVTDVYFDYLNRNFYKFDVLLFMVDLNSGLNTEGEMKVLNTITDHIKKAVENKKKVHMITIINKCDNMAMDRGKLKLGR